MSINWSNIPFPPRRLPFFYGWVLLAACTVGIVASIPGQTMGVGIFTDSLMDVLGLTRSQLSLAYALGTIASGLLLPRAGRWIDQFGLRIMAVFASAGMGFSLYLLSHVEDLAALSPLSGAMPGMMAIFVCFLCLRFFGQGCLTMVSRVGVGKWFNHRRGLAVALMGLVTAFTFNASPKFLNYLLETEGWRGASLQLAGLSGLAMGIIALVFYRDNPEACGLSMDGRPEPDPLPDGSAVIAAPVEFTRTEAARTLAFWSFSLGPASQGLIITAVTFHMASIGEHAGVSREVAYSVFIPMAFFSIASNTLGGWLSDRIQLKWLLLFMMVMQFIGTAGLSVFGSSGGRWAVIVGFGLAGGLFSTMTTVPFPRYFGRAHLGSISGLSMSVMVYASAIGPYFFSLGLDFFDSYRAVSLACLVLPTAIAVLGWIAPDPRDQAAHASS